jgi:hypothetical protein
MSDQDTKTPPQPPDELVHADDAVIGRAFRRSVIGLAIIGLLGAGAFLALRQKPQKGPTRLTPLSAPTAPVRTGAAEIPSVKFTDITAAAGIHFSRHNGAEGDRLLPETMGGGVAFLDYDADGDQDLLFINGADWPWAKQKATKPPTMALYRNDGKGRFDEVTAGSGLDISLYGMGAAVADFDNDGLTDVFVTAVGGNRLSKTSALENSPTSPKRPGLAALPASGAQRRRGSTSTTTATSTSSWATTSSGPRRSISRWVTSSWA